jgi:hypothetical protein
MNAMLLLVAILFGFIAVAGYNLVTLNQTFNISASIQQNYARVQIVSNSVRTALTVVDGRVAVPISSSLSATVPSVSPFNTSANGTPYVYCPILPALAEGTARLDNAAASESYAVDTVERNGLTYAVAGRPGGADDAKIVSLGVVAYLITPQPNAIAPLKCSDARVADDGSTILVTGGSVSAVYDNPVAADGASFVISPSGARPAEAATSDRVARGVSDVIEYVKHYDINDVRLRVFGNETLKATDMNALFALSAGRTVRIQGPEGVRAVVKFEEDGAVQNGLIEFAARGRAVLSNVSLKGASGADVGIASSPGGSVSLDDAIVARVRSNGGEILISGSSRVTPSASADALAFPVSADGGRITFAVSDDATAPSIVSQSSSAVFATRGGDIVLKSDVHAVAGSLADMFRTESGGRLRIATEGAEVLVDRGSGYAAETYTDLQRVTATCADGDPTCTAICPPAKRVAWGECGSGNGAALAGFSVDATGTQYTCQWAQMTIAVAPKAAVVCQTQ